MYLLPDMRSLPSLAHCRNKSGLSVKAVAHTHTQPLRSFTGPCLAAEDALCRPKRKSPEVSQRSPVASSTNAQSNSMTAASRNPFGISISKYTHSPWSLEHDVNLGAGTNGSG